MTVQTNFCPFCGTNLERNSRYCHNCGAYLEQEISETAKPIKIISEKPLEAFPEIYVPKNIKHTAVGSGYGKTNVNERKQNEVITQEQENHQTRKQNDGQGIISFLFAILAIIGILPIFGSILAILTGGYKGGPLGIIGRTIGWVSLLFYLSFTFLMFF